MDWTTPCVAVASSNVSETTVCEAKARAGRQAASRIAATTSVVFSMLPMPQPPDEIYHPRGPASAPTGRGHCEDGAPGNRVGERGEDRAGLLELRRSEAAP